MSYILDSLRKAEQKRQTDDSKMPVFFGSPPPAKKKRPVWLYLLFAVLLLNGMAMILFVTIPWSDKKSENTTKTPLSDSVAFHTSKTVQEPAKISGEVMPKSEVGGSLPSSVQKLKVKEPAAAATKQIPAEQPAVPKSKLFALNELPEDVKNNLPAFKVSGHAYSPNRQNRVTRVNEKILQEGEELIAGIKVEEINPEGIIFKYQGYRFLVRTNENR